jgi:glycosyltransferase EpsD
MKNKILFVANIHKHFRAFHLPYFNLLKQLGYEVHVAANDPDTLISEADKQFNIPISRSPFSLNNIKSIFKIKRIINDEKYCLLHCHTAAGSVVARIAAAKTHRKNGMKVLYTVHGFHFYKGSPKRFWLLYYPIEKLMSRYCDAIITINQEDYELIISKKFACSKVYKINGVGINTKRLDAVDEAVSQIRRKNNYSKDTILILYIAEFIDRKNHKFLINAMNLLKETEINFKLLLAGRGRNLVPLNSYIHRNHLDKYIDILGYRNDIGDLIAMSDIGVSVSKQEGLPMNIAEQMYLGKPIVASNIRGHKDLIVHGENGFLFDLPNKSQLVDYLLLLIKNKKMREDFGKRSIEIADKYTLSNTISSMANIYTHYLN